MVNLVRIDTKSKQTQKLSSRLYYDGDIRKVYLYI